MQENKIKTLIEQYCNAEITGKQFCDAVEACSSASNNGNTLVNCSSCHAQNSIRNNKVEIDIGDEQGSVASVQFEYCEKCGWRGSVEWFD